MSGRQQLWILVGIVVLAAVLRLVVAGHSSLWGDEVFSIAIATGHSLEHPAAAARPERGDFVEPDHAVPAEEFRKYLKHDSPLESPARVVRAALLSDTSPPLYYFLLYAWTLLVGTSDLALRSFSIVCSLLCLPLLVLIARRVAGDGTALVSAVLFACSPLAIYYSTEGRMYSLVWLCVLTTIWISLVLHQRGGGIGFLALWVVTSAAGFLTHYFFLFPWLTIVAFLVISPGKFGRRRLFGCIFLTGLAILPWYLILPQSLNNWRVTQGWLKMEPGGFRRWRETRNFFLQFFLARGPDLTRIEKWSSLGALALFAVIAAVAAWRLRLRMFTQYQLLLLLCFLAACGGPIVVDFIQHTYLVAKPRYSMAALPAAYLLAAVGLSCLHSRARVAILALIVCAWVPSILSVYHERVPWLRMRTIARAASKDTDATDLILVHSIPSGVLSIARYASGPAAIASWVGQLKNRHVPESIEQLAHGRTRIVFVKVHDVGEPAPEETWLRNNSALFNEKHFQLGTVSDFRPKGMDTF